ncbi:VRR-NUC domain-containing protein [Microbulbifer epialgicus]|uniref:VRR-NUC domain-containing protein n=1 Tax=Microbulbifer epialgicus TaxID=393907 RepID=A0ABV4NUC6_9GAMM
MSLRLTEAQVLDHQKRIARGRTKNIGSTDAATHGYNLQQHTVNALELGTRRCPSSPLIVTLNLGLKALVADDGNPKPYERIEQAITLLWLECIVPEAYTMTTAIPLGGYRPAGVGGQMRGEGAKHGFPDLLMDKVNQDYHGLRIEMKKFCPNAKPSTEQHDWLTRLSKEGYRAVLCRGHQAAIKVFSEYLELNTPIQKVDLPEWAIVNY